ncbi:hypothetical protein [uncultured Sphingomonas sp.]|uniref:hypothetical protein n=1 Tax=uncultured Sphingomonas sp. TaxID=158754 RepID=UPI0025F377D8|nr:hypothetical protein [uncultured Sphingomonas sp.]
MTHEELGYRVIGERRSPKRCYVYAHLGPDRVPFYIGKGTGTRAWSTDRDAQWHRFVRTRCDSAYEIVILAEDLAEEDALDLEGYLIAKHGKTLTNWINPGRQFDYAALDRFHKLRAAWPAAGLADTEIGSFRLHQLPFRSRWG